MPAKRLNINRKRKLVKAGLQGVAGVVPSGKNLMLVQGKVSVPLWTRSEVAKRKKLHLILKKGVKPAKKVEKIEKPTKTKKYNGKKSGNERTVGLTLSKLEAVLEPKRTGKAAKQHKPRVRESLTAGKILILLAGHFAGKRVVLLKVFDSGLLLVTGPFKLNGVPVRRVNPAFVIATSTSVEIPKSVADKVAALTEKDFSAQVKKPQKPKKLSEEEPRKKGEKVKRSSNPEVEERTPERIKLQEEIDEPLIASIGKIDMLSGYLKARFTLSPGDFPHSMKF